MNTQHTRSIVTHYLQREWCLLINCVVAPPMTRHNILQNVRTQFHLFDSVKLILQWFRFSFAASFGLWIWSLAAPSPGEKHQFEEDFGFICVSRLIINITGFVAQWWSARLLTGRLWVRLPSIPFYFLFFKIFF